jgi:hypothetical protein
MHQSAASLAVLALLVYTSACHAAILTPQGVHTERLEDALLEGESVHMRSNVSSRGALY